MCLSWRYLNIFTCPQGDVITKDSNVTTVERGQCQSHKEWILLTNFFKDQGVCIKRVFLTATPENILYKYVVEYVIRLHVPETYRGYKNMKFSTLKSDHNIEEILLAEENRRVINKENGVILYCVDRKIKNGQDRTFQSICSYLSCVVSIYNGKGITARVPSKFFEQQLRLAAIADRKLGYLQSDDGIWTIKNLPIKYFYQMCKDVGCGIILTIGKDLVQRGISFVSAAHTPDAVAATTMIYKPGPTMHAVGLAQTIGRITGLARPDLERTLYAPQDVIDTFIDYNINQESYLEKYVEGVNMQDIMENHIMSKRLGRPMDRHKLHLMPKFDSADTSEVASETVDGVNWGRLENWLQKDVLVSRMIKVLYSESEPIHVSSLIKKVGYASDMKKFQHNINDGRGKKSCYGRLWWCKKDYMGLSDSVRNYIDALPAF